ncbi:hypothetical protein C8R45DRAFT_271620 [Mycena sanguinolenta]|nr:hypothetical protein C8R45DRAFT_271620 [Mycena sanguinolenta]
MLTFRLARTMAMSMARTTSSQYRLHHPQNLYWSLQVASEGHGDHAAFVGHEYDPFFEHVMSRVRNSPQLNSPTNVCVTVHPESISGRLIFSSGFHAHALRRIGLTFGCYYFLFRLLALGRQYFSWSPETRGSTFRATTSRKPLALLTSTMRRSKLSATPGCSLTSTTARSSRYGRRPETICETMRRETRNDLQDFCATSTQFNNSRPFFFCGVNDNDPERPVYAGAGSLCNSTSTQNDRSAFSVTLLLTAN